MRPLWFHHVPWGKKAMDSFFSDKHEEVVSLPTGQGFVVRKNQ